MFTHIVVGVDGREGGRDAVALARLLVAVGGSLTLAYVVAPDAHVHGGTSDAPEASDGGRAKALLEAVRGETGVDAHLFVPGTTRTEFSLPRDGNDPPFGPPSGMEPDDVAAAIVAQLRSGEFEAFACEDYARTAAAKRAWSRMPSRTTRAPRSHS